MKNPIRGARFPFHYGWIVVGVTFFTLLISAGVRSTPGILIIPLEQQFGWNRTIITFPLAINLALYGLCGPFSAALMSRYGIRRTMTLAMLMLVIGTGFSAWMQTPWELTLTWGVLVGLGSGFTSSVLGAVISTRWFVKRRGFVVGILSASGAAGQLVFLPLLARAVTTYGWQFAVWGTAISAGLVVVAILVFMSDHPSDIGLQPYGASDNDMMNSVSANNPFFAAFEGLKSGLRSKDFWFLAGSFFICGATTNGLINTHFIPATMEKGMLEISAAKMLALMGIFNIMGTTLSGWLSDRLDNRWLLFWYYALRGFSLLFLHYALGNEFIGLIFFIIFYGLDAMATVPPTIRLSSELFAKQGPVVFGWIFAFHQLGAATAAFGGGFLRTRFGDYQLTFISAALLCLIASGLVIRIRKRALPIS